eukprot:m.755148 g.755148  ORF g.755148 m.755148 type:complete len:114 (+) comp59009_c0_seq1:777-1118(+)
MRWHARCRMLTPSPQTTLATLQSNQPLQSHDQDKSGTASAAESFTLDAAFRFVSDFALFIILCLISVFLSVFISIIITVSQTNHTVEAKSGVRTLCDAALSGHHYRARCELLK